MTSDTPRTEAPDPWLEDIVRCGEASLARWQEHHRNEETGALTFIGADGPFYEGIRSVVERLRDYHFVRTRSRAALSASDTSESQPDPDPLYRPGREP